MRALVNSIIIALIVGLMTWRKDFLYPLFLAILTLFIVGKIKMILKGYLLFMPLILGISWFNGYVSFMHGGSFLTTFIMVFARLLTLINFSAYFILTIEPYELAENFSKVMSPSIAYIFYIAYNIMQATIKRYQDTYQAMKSRYLLKSRISIIKLLVPITISVINYIYNYSEMLGVSMDARGFDDKRIFWRKVMFTKKDILRVVILLFAGVIGYFFIPTNI
jgi:energy-coupling factor transporter transmembrane protein EcfT